MGKKPFVGVVGTLWLGLSLAGSGCESCGCGSKGSYQAPNGNLRGLVSGSPATQPSAQAGVQPAAQTPSTVQTAGQSWTNPPKTMSTVPSSPVYPTTTPSQMPIGPANNAGAVTPAGGFDSKVPTPPAVNTTGTPVSSTSWPSPSAADGAIRQTSASVPAATDDVRVPMGTPSPKAQFTAQRMSDAPASPMAVDTSAKMLLPPPPTTSRSTSAAAVLPPPSGGEPTNAALIAPPPVTSGISTAPAPVGGPATDMPLPPPVPGAMSPK